MTLNGRKLIFFCNQLSVGDSFLVGVGANIRLTPWAPTTCLAWICAGSVPAATVSVSTYVCQSWCVWKTLFPWSHPSALALTVFSLLFLHQSLSLEGRSWWRHPVLQSLSFTLYTLSNDGFGLCDNTDGLQEASLIKNECVTDLWV